MELSELDNIKSQMMILMAEKHKYKLMWHLRSLEKELAEDGGYIKIRRDTKLEVKIFSQELMDKIAERLKSYK